jgi:hypothetical protein
MASAIVVPDTEAEMSAAKPERDLADEPVRGER